MGGLAYLGTPELAVPPLEALVAAGHEVVLVVSGPDRRRGRGGATSPSPVKAAARDLGISVTDDLGALVGSGAELGVVVAYGRLVPAAVLAQVPMVNLHFSLLPRWRGAAPVERAILAGDQLTGVCVMKLEEGLDTGPVYSRDVVEIGDDDLVTLRARLVAVGSRRLVDLLAKGVAGLPEPVPQQGEATYAPKITPADRQLRFDRPAVELARVVRVGGAWTTFRGARLLVHAAAVVPVAAVPAILGPAPPGPGAPPGTLVGDLVATGEGWLRVVRVQAQGARLVEAAAWLRGARPKVGEVLGGR